MPDGRRVNPKSLAQVYQSQQQQQQNGNGNGNGNTGGAGATTSPSAAINMSGGNSVGSGGNSQLNSINNNNGISINYYNPTTPSAAIPTPKLITPIQSIPNTTSSFNPTTITSPFESPINHHQRAFSSTSPLKSSTTTATSPFTSSIWSTDPRYRSFSHSNTVSRPFFKETINESAIMDDDDDNNDDDDEDDADDDDVFEEDFVPSSLSDLLTPQELKRRGSRPGSNGVRPVLQKPVHQGHRNGEEDEMQFRLEEDWING